MNYERSYLNTRNFEGRTLTVTYAVVETCNIYAKAELSSVFSLACAMYDGQGEVESAFVYDVTREKERAKKLAELLCREFVTPKTMGYVIEDML